VTGPSDTGSVRAAGGVVVREVRGAIEIAIVHRPRYDDWSLPKGKLLDGESFEEGAEREVTEETGLQVRRGEELPPVRYRDRRGRPKIVRYWLMTCTGGAFSPNDEVDVLRWVSPRQAARLLSYPHDRALVVALEPR
jgi:8-oxo-dGTP diphosphatase